MRYPMIRSWRAWLPLAGCVLVIALLCAQPWTERPVNVPGGDSYAVRKAAAFSRANTPWTEGKALRVGAPEPIRQASVISPYGPGFEFELIGNFCEVVSCMPQWVNVPDKETGFAMLLRGEIDVLVGFWGGGPASGTAGTETPEYADDGVPSPIAAGKAYAHFNPVRISGAAVPGLLDGAESVPASSGDASSSLGALSRAFGALIPALVEKSAPAAESAEEPPFPVFSLVMDAKRTSGEDIVLLDPASYALWLPFMGDIDSTRVKRPTPYRWFWRDDRSALSLRFSLFWDSPERVDELAEMTERYFGFLPRNLRQRDILELADTLASRLPGYETFIMKAAKETGVPPLLLAAAIYQESRFDPEAVSETRVRGIMQLTMATADMLKVDRKDPEQCIMGGARYLRELWDKLEGKAASDWDRWFMALAAYNQGLSNVHKAIKMARDRGKPGDTWADLKQVFPLSTTCRGIEAKSFVERIRYYNFILHGLVALAPPETEDFAPLLSLALAAP